ncbi:MAG: occludin [Bacteroides sp.]|nr:occludin [Bacteroides sp.]
MKRFFFCIIALFAGISAVCAQNEVQADSIHSPALPDGTPPEGIFSPHVKSYDGFLLDMNLMKMEAPRLPKFTLEIPDTSKDYSRIFQLNPDVTYSQGLSNVFSLTNATVYSMNPFGLTGFWSSPENLQMGSFRLKNWMQINTYGEYDKDGWKVRNPSALPWEKNNFKGAFEMKSANGAFGIRIEVQQGNKSPF